MTEQTSVAPWFKQPWFWFLTIFPIAAIVWCIFMIIVATNIDNSMVTDDYSKKGRAINMEIARDTKAREMGIEARFAFDQRYLSLNVTTSQGTANFPYLILNLFHPTLSDQDRTVQLTRIGEGKYEARLNQDIDGRWYFDLRGPDNDWRLKGEAFLPASEPVQLSAGTDPQG
ncbi:MAG TPA: nitrogen fixation protein FixH [Marinobacter sp.]|jgi:hypothetical protein|uniref:FixH family protein n=1 Tax=Marinobacter sp. TaxID=50741 RepID=UPI000EE7596E|nr:FixH family protein [Marinobacter sp.]MBC7193326.1 FixH family protein [Marinobacter sp.]HCW89881.1 nitrogen fixation protein FixH [Marinobacter sp.]